MNYILETITCNKYVDYCTFNDINNKNIYIRIYFYHRTYENTKDFYFFILNKNKTTNRSKILKIEKPFDILSIKDLQESNVWQDFDENELDDLRVLVKNFYKLTKFDIRYGL